MCMMITDNDIEKMKRMEDSFFDIRQKIECILTSEQLNAGEVTRLCTALQVVVTEMWQFLT